jgi:chromosome segregation ATPase
VLHAPGGALLSSSMEEHKSSLSPQESAGAVSASALRQLQERAQHVFSTSREQTARLEADITQHLDAIFATLNEQTALETQAASEADSLKTEIARLAEELENARAIWLVERAELELQRDNFAQKVITLESEADAQRNELARKLAEVEKLQATWLSERSELEKQRDELTQALSGSEKEREELVQAVSRLESGFDARHDELAGKITEFEDSQAAWLAERSQLETQRDELSQKVFGLETELQSSQDEWRNQLLDFESRLREQQNSWNEQRSDWTLARSGLERQRDELQQKFDLALEDVQRLRARVAELEQDLARRPESNQADSAELVALRAERDALAARVEQLEQRPVTQIDPNVEQQLVDLQRRFELAVEDVRELKMQNAKLESKLAASSSSPPRSQSDIGGSDWESQKRRLLAALEEGGDSHPNPIPKEERLKIESTIEMTDAVVAEKDRQIAELQIQLAAANDGSAIDTERASKVKDLIDADEVIAEHRQRIRELEREMEEKLRTAELELSVERAKMARHKMELDELKADLESQRQAFEAAGGAPAQGQPRRRWLNKLGLTGEE